MRLYTMVYNPCDTHYLQKCTVKSIYIVQDGVHPNTISKLKKNQCVNTDTINTLCRILNVKPGDILDYIPDEPQRI